MTATVTRSRIAPRWRLAGALAVAAIVTTTRAGHPQSPRSPRVFAPGIISLPDTYELNGAFSPDGNLFYLTRCARGDNRPRDCRIVVSQRRDSLWQPARPLLFSREHEDIDPAFSADGRTMVFLSRRPLPGAAPARADWNIWFVDRIGNDWGTPRPAGPTINSDSSELFASFGPGGELYFGSLRAGGLGLGDLYVAPSVGGGFGDPHSLGSGVNSPAFETDPVISADGRFLVFTSLGRAGGKGSGDIYISHQVNGRWLPAEPLDVINTEARECCGALSPDGRTLYFSRLVGDQTDLYEVSAAAIGIPVLPTGPGAAPPPDSIRVERVAGSVSAFTFIRQHQRMNVAASIGPDGILLVDYQPPMLADTLSQMLSAMSPGPIRYLLNTHWHLDHTGGNVRYGGHTPIVAHTRVRDRLMQHQTPSWSGATGIARLPAHAWPTLTFTDSIVLHLNGERIVMFHPGVAHTDGDAVVLFEQSGVAAMGDLFSGRGQVSGDDWYSGNPVDYEVALRRIADRLPAETQLITGHGGIASTADLREFIDLYAALLSFVRGVPEPTPDSSLNVPGSLAASWAAWRLPDGHLRRLAVVLRSGLIRTSAATRRLGNSGTDGAQRDFDSGLTALQNFQYLEAARYFARAQRADPAFALAYWGEALTHHRPLWGHHDPAAARQVLARLAASPESRAARVPLPLERELVSAADALFAESDRAAAAQQFASRVRAIADAHPADADLAALHGLSVLATAAPGDAGLRARMQAAGLLETSLQRWPQHPGLNHYLIHAYDDPVHAPLGERAARVYADLAPQSPHAQHMPAHIFFQLGRWADGSRANEAAWTSSVRDQEASGWGVERRDYHSMMWLGYSLIQEGRIGRAEGVADELAGSAQQRQDAPVLISYRTVQALLGLEGSQRHRLAVGDARVGSASTQANLLGAVGIAAFRAGDAAALASARTAVDTLRPHVVERDAPYIDVIRLTLDGAQRHLAGATDSAIRLLDDAALRESRLPFPSGLPTPLVPAHEVLGEVLLAASRSQDAAGAFSRALGRTPNRASVLLGLARARLRAGDADGARRAYHTLAAIWTRADQSLVALREVRAAVGADGLDASGTDVGESLLVVNRSGHEVVRVDLATGSVRARWKTGDGPHEVVLAGNRHAYVPAFGIYPEAHASPFPSDSRPPSVTGRGGALTVVDTETQAVRTLDVAPCMRPHGVAASRDGARVWVTCQDLREVREFDGATGSLRRTFATQADGSHIIVASPSDDALWVANVTDGNVTAIDLASGSTSVVPTAPGAEGIAFAPDARELWVANTRDNSISIIDAARRAVIETVSSGGEFPVKLAFIASRGETWVVNNGSNSIAVFDARTRRLKASIPLDTTPLGIAASGDGDRVYVSAPRENGVLVIDAESRQVTRRIRTGIEPDGIVWVPAPARR